MSGWNQENKDFLWKKLLEYNGLYEEFVYYLEHHEFCGGLSFGGYSLIDLYVRQMEHYNLIHDIGKNTGNCNKEDMVLRAFYTMAAFFENPAYFLLFHCIGVLPLSLERAPSISSASLDVFPLWIRI